MCSRPAQSTCGRYVSHGAVLKTLSKYAGVVCCCKEKCECERRFIKKVRTHISAKASTALLAGAVASRGSSIRGTTSGAEVLS